MTSFGPAEVQLLTSLTQMLTTVVLWPDQPGCGGRHERGILGLCSQDKPPEDFGGGGNRTAAWFGEFPWLASVRGAPPSRKDFPLPVCSGVLVHPQVVLVSAACYDESLERDFKLTVRLAEYAINTEEDFGRSPADHQVLRAIKHPDYRRQGRSVQNDVALLLLDRPADLADDVATVCLPPAAADATAAAALAEHWELTDCVVAGWSDPRKNTIDAVLWEKVDFLSRDSCQTRLRALRRLSVFQELHASFVCGTAEKDCWADVGSPLVCRGSRDPSRWTLVAVVPWARLHEVCDQVVIYTSVARFVDWITDTIFAELSTQ